jgi:23S rRNA pseudouridine2605 synthase
MSQRSDPDEGRIRLQKVLAAAGVGSRRACEDLIKDGRVEVDGVVVDELGSRVDPLTAVVRVDGERVVVNPDRVYLAVNKPRGYLSAMSDDRGRKTLAELVPVGGARLFHVGRLDVDTEGLIILTNDGDLAQRLAHPSYEIRKTYLADVEGAVGRETVRRILDGVQLDDGPVQADACRVVDQALGRSLVELVIHEGRNRIVRRLFDELGHPVRGLVRTAIGDVRLGDLPSGTTRPLGRAELSALLDATADGSPGTAPKRPRRPIGRKTSSKSKGRRRVAGSTGRAG